MQSKKLYRSRKNRFIAGVCGGFANYFSLNPTVVRIVWAFSALFNGLGIIAYIISLILMPVNPNEKQDEKKQKPENVGLIVGLFLIGFGLLIFLNQTTQFVWHYNWPFFVFPFARLQYFWPIVFILFGIWFIVYTIQKDREQPTQKEQKKLYRSKSNRMIGGVCGGLAQYLNVDATIVRIGYVLITVMTHMIIGIGAYVILLLVIPEYEKESKTKTSRTKSVQTKS